MTIIGRNRQAGDPLNNRWKMSGHTLGKGGWTLHKSASHNVMLRSPLTHEKSVSPTHADKYIKATWVPWVIKMPLNY